MGGRRVAAERFIEIGDIGRIRVRAARTLLASKRAGDLVLVIVDLQNAGSVSLRMIAAELNERGITTARGGAWSAVQVQRVVRQLPMGSLTGPASPRKGAASKGSLSSPYPQIPPHDHSLLDRFEVSH